MALIAQRGESDLLSRSRLYPPGWDGGVFGVFVRVGEHIRLEGNSLGVFCLRLGKRARYESPCPTHHCLLSEPVVGHKGARIEPLCLKLHDKVGEGGEGFCSLFVCGGDDGLGDVVDGHLAGERYNIADLCAGDSLAEDLRALGGLDKVFGDGGEGLGVLGLFVGFFGGGGLDGPLGRGDCLGVSDLLRGSDVYRGGGDDVIQSVS